ERRPPSLARCALASTRGPRGGGAVAESFQSVCRSRTHGVRTKVRAPQRLARETCGSQARLGAGRHGKIRGWLVLTLVQLAGGVSEYILHPAPRQPLACRERRQRALDDGGGVRLESPHRRLCIHPTRSIVPRSRGRPDLPSARRRIHAVGDSMRASIMTARTSGQMTPRASVGGGRRLAISWGDHLGSLAQPGVHLTRALPERGQRRIQKDLSRFQGQAQRAPPVIADLPASPRQREQDPPFYLWVWVWHFRQYRLRALQRFFRLQEVAPRGSAIEVGFAQPQQPRATLGERCVRTSAEVLERGGVLVAQPPDLATRIQRN